MGDDSLDQPPMNAISVQVQAKLRDAAAVVTSTPEIDAAVIYLYRGEKVFAAGTDVKEMAEKSYPEMALVSRRCTRRSPPLPRSPSQLLRR